MKAGGCRTEGTSYIYTPVTASPAVVMAEQRQEARQNGKLLRGTLVLHHTSKIPQPASTSIVRGSDGPVLPAHGKASIWYTWRLT
jgi:hypothetical protein